MSPGFYFLNCSKMFSRCFEGELFWPNIQFPASTAVWKRMRSNDAEVFIQVSLNPRQPFLAKTKEQFCEHLLCFTSYDAFLHSLFKPSQQSHEGLRSHIRSQGSWAYRGYGSCSHTHKCCNLLFWILAQSVSCWCACLLGERKRKKIHHHQTFHLWLTVFLQTSVF